MTVSPGKEKVQDVPDQVFKKFLEALQGSGASAQLVARLSKTLLEDKAFSDVALREAVLGEESIP